MLSDKQHKSILTIVQHKPGILRGNDNVPEYQAETLPPGTAPKENTFQPNPVSEVPPVANQMDDADISSEQASAADTVGGSTSADVHQGLGHPGQGQSSAEIRHDGQSKRNNPGASLQGVGASTQEFKTVDHRDPKFKDHRGIDKEDKVTGRGEILSAEEREAESATTVAHEHGSKSRQDRGK